MNDVLKLLKSHRSIRRYKDQPIPDDLLNQILDAARQAPTSSNLQTYSIIVVRDQQKKQELARLCGNQVWVEKCPVFLAMCPDLNRLERVCMMRQHQFQDQYIEISMVSIVDTALVAQNIAVACESLGIGICMIGAIRNNPEEVSKLLKLPERVFPLMGMCLGYPDHEPMIKPRLPLEAIVHHEEYDESRYESLIKEYDETLRATGLYEGTNRKINSPQFAPVPDDDYSWSEHSSRRAASTDPKTLRVHLRQFLQSKRIGLE